MSRSKAKKQLNLADEIKILDDQGIIHGMRQDKDLDEAVSAYKDINIVMENQKDLTEIFTELSPIASMKGQ
jgi:tRNA-splicing ligase RtcB